MKYAGNQDQDLDHKKERKNVICQSQQAGKACDSETECSDEQVNEGFFFVFSRFFYTRKYKRKKRNDDDKQYNDNP